MPNFKFENNPKTGLPEANVTMTLKSLPTNSRVNSNGNTYYPVSVSFFDKNDVEQSSTAIIYQGNIDRANENGGLSIGEMYAGQVTIDEGRAYLRISHLPSGNWATADMFGFTEKEVNKEKLPVGQERF